MTESQLPPTPTGSSRDTLIARIRKLLAKAESTTNANEAEAFSAKAAELIAAHRLDVRQVRESIERGDLAVREVVLGRGAYVRARLSLLMAVAGNHDCEVVFRTGPDGTVAMVAGYADDLDLTELLYHSLHTQAAGQMATIRRRTPSATQQYRRSFMFGYARRINEVFAESRSPASTAAPASGAVGTLPDVLERSSRVKAFASASFGRVVTASRARPARHDAWADGHRAAGRADLGRSRIVERRAIGPGPRTSGR